MGPLVPCDCRHCYFCVKGLTSGIQHRENYRKVKVIAMKTGNITRLDAYMEMRLPLGRGSNYYAMCYRKLAGEIGGDGEKLNTGQEHNRCKHSTMGCPQPSCNEPICK